MGKVIVTLKIMPESPDVDLDALDATIKTKITESTGDDEFKSEQEPIGFGLKALKITFIVDEDKGSTDALEEAIGTIDGVNSVEAIDVRRAMG